MTLVFDFQLITLLRLDSERFSKQLQKQILDFIGKLCIALYPVSDTNDASSGRGGYVIQRFLGFYFDVVFRHSRRQKPHAEASECLVKFRLDGQKLAS